MMIEDKILIDGKLIFMQIMPGTCENPNTIEVKPFESIVPGIWIFEHEVFGQIQALGQDSLMVITHGSPLELALKDRRDAAITRAVELAFQYARGLPIESKDRRVALVVAGTIRGVVGR